MSGLYETVRRTAASTPLTLALLAAWLFGCPRPPGVRYPGLPTLPDGAMHIIVFDVGQADATLVVVGTTSLLIDAGASRSDPTRAAHRIPRRLEALTGSRRLDYFLASHYHQDHLGAPARNGGRQSRPSGLYALLEQEGVTVDTLLDRGQFTVGVGEGPSATRYATAARRWLQTGAVQTRRTLHAGDRFPLGKGAWMEVLCASGNGHLERLAAAHPRLFEEYPPGENDYSVGVKLTMGDFEMFTAGDLNGQNVLRQFGTHKQSASDMESRIAGRVGAVEVYRVNHHGSRHSTNACFAQVLHPAVSIFSVGENSYGHPGLDVVERLRKTGDTLFTGGAAAESRMAVAHEIVGDDIDIVVAPQGQRFWVNGRGYLSLSDTEEASRPGAVAACTVAAIPDASVYEPPEAADREPD